MMIPINVLGEAGDIMLEGRMPALTTIESGVFVEFH